jgi:hypothetical protein
MAIMTITTDNFSTKAAPLELLLSRYSSPLNRTAGKMDSRRDDPISFSYCQQNRQILATFIRSLEHLDPWYQLFLQ